MIYFLYILECQNNSLYIGYTTDIERRYQEHCQGSPKCKYTRSFPPRRLAACWRLEAQLGEVLQLERSLKSLKRKEKELLTKDYALLRKYTPLNFSSLDFLPSFR